MSLELVSVLAAGVITGGIGLEIVKHFLGSRERERSSEFAEAQWLYPTIIERLDRQDAEIMKLQAMVLALSKEVHDLGGDPLAVRHRVDMEWREIGPKE